MSGSICNVMAILTSLRWRCKRSLYQQIVIGDHHNDILAGFLFGDGLR